MDRTDNRDMTDREDGARVRTTRVDGARGRRNARRGANGRYISDRADNANYGDGNDFNEDFNDDFNDYGDYHHMKPEMRLRKADMLEWKRDMENTDGTHGGHFSMDEIMRAAKKLNVRFDTFTEKEFCLAVNMIYSDFGHCIRRIGGQENELYNCADFALAFLDDPDGPEGFEKLALYYYCIVCYGEL